MSPPMPACLGNYFPVESHSPAAALATNYSTMLCATCLSVFERNPRGNTVVRGQHHANIANLRAAARQGCYLCFDLIIEYDESGNDNAQVELSDDTDFLTFELQLSRDSHRFGYLSFEFVNEDLSSASYEVVHTGNLARPANYDDFLRNVRADLSNEPWRVRDDGFPSSSAVISKSTGDPNTVKIAAQWLETCLESHSSCESFDPSVTAPWYPKRLLDLSSAEGKLRLVETKDHGPKGRYATLSHCWGPKPICTLTTNNIDEYKKNVPASILTNTFRDAINASRMLKIRYIWIDSLCIIQTGDGGEDWFEHAKAMRLVYSNSLINIAAADAEEGADGMFNERQDTFLRPCHVQWEWPKNFHHFDDGAFWTIRRGNHHSAMSLKTSPLYARGWVVQERFLAPRVLHFAEDRLMWECMELPFAEESFPAGFQDSCPDYEPIMKWPFDGSAHKFQVPSPEYSSAHNPIHALWQDMVTGYTNCDLSFPKKDIFIALAGIAENLGQGFDNQYVAGLFRQHLPFDLMWQNKGRIADEYRAPSWSWASIDGPVELRAFSDCPFCDYCCTRLADVQDVKVELADVNNIYGQIESAELTLSGYLLPCQIEPISKAGTGLRQKLSIYFQADETIFTIDSELHVEGEADVDDDARALRGYTSGSQYRAWALPIVNLKLESNHIVRHCGLLVEAASNGKYRRVGIYRLRKHIMEKGQSMELPKRKEIALV